MLDSDVREALRCIRCGACMNHCPVYQNIGGQFVNRSENNGAFGTLSSTSTFNNGDTGGSRVIQMTLRLQF